MLLLQVLGKAVGFDERRGFFSLFYEERMIFIATDVRADDGAGLRYG